MPGIVTKPPSGIAPSAYSMSFLLNFAIAGGKPTKNLRGRSPTASEAKKCPASWMRMSSSSPTIAMKKLTTPPCR